MELVYFPGLITSRTPRAVVPVWVPSKPVGERAQKLQSCPLWLYVCGVQYRGPVDTCEGEIMVFKKFRLVQISLQVQIHPGALCEREGGSLLSPCCSFSCLSGDRILPLARVVECGSGEFSRSNHISYTMGGGAGVGPFEIWWLLLVVLRLRILVRMSSRCLCKRNDCICCMQSENLRSLQTAWG